MKRGLLMIVLALCGEAFAGQVWTANTIAQATVVVNQGSALRDMASEYGILFSADYLEDRGITLGLSNTFVKFRQALPQVNQQAAFLSLREHFYPDLTGGRLTLRADALTAANDDGSGLTDDVQTLVVQSAWLSGDRQIWLDLGVAGSRYGGQLEVKQATPTVGMALWRDAGWLQLRGCRITYSDPALAQNFSATNSLDMKYSHWLMPGSRFKPTSLQFAAMGGQRLFAVDLDAGTVANLADLQTGGLALGAEWKLWRSGKLMVLAGQNRYENVSLSNRYKGNFLYLNLNAGW